MSDLKSVVGHLVEASDTVEDVEAIVAAINYLESADHVELGADTLSDLFGDRPDASECRSLLYSMEEASVITDEGVDREALQTATGAAKATVTNGVPPENDIVVNVPEHDDSNVGSSFGSLVVRLVELVASADDQMTILNPFFTEEAFGNVVSPVANAVDRGVSVTLVTRYLTYGSDDANREFVTEVLSECTASNGDLELYEYIDPEEGSTATIHSKMTVVDRSRVYLGTANFTHRGLHENLEIGVIFRDETVGQFVRFVDELRHSRLLHEVEIEDESFCRI